MVAAGLNRNEVAYTETERQPENFIHIHAATLCVFLSGYLKKNITEVREKGTINSGKANFVMQDIK